MGKTQAIVKINTQHPSLVTILNRWDALLPGKMCIVTTQAIILKCVRARVVSWNPSLVLLLPVRIWLSLTFAILSFLAPNFHLGKPYIYMLQGISTIEKLGIGWW